MAEMEMVRPQFILFGDSITDQSFRPGGWGAALADTYSRKADIIVRGYGGYNTRWALFLLNLLFPVNYPMHPAVVTIFFGANDAALLGRTSERQYVPIEEYKENLRKIVNHIKVLEEMFNDICNVPIFAHMVLFSSDTDECSAATLVVLISPPPVDEDGRKKYAQSVYGENAMKLPERTNENTGTYSRQCVELANELHIPCIDLWSKMQETTGWQQEFLRDGLHLTEKGNAVVYEEVLRVLNECNLRAEAMQYDFPHHSKIDATHPERAFEAKKDPSSWGHHTCNFIELP